MKRDNFTFNSVEICHAHLLAWAGESFQLSMKPIWVRPLAIAISVHQAFGEFT